MLTLLAAIWLTVAAPSPELTCLAKTVYGEARGESNWGQQLVARAVLNRMEDKRWPATACGVVQQAKQFIGYRVAIRDHAAYAIALANARLADTPMQLDICLMATHFHVTGRRPRWAKSERVIHLCTVGNHDFYYEQRRQ